MRFWLLLGTFSICLATPLEAANSKDSVVKVFVTANKVDHYRPWQSQGIKAASASGSIIEGNKILTNAHVVSDQTFIQVKKSADAKKYTAKVVAMGHDCDLALLSVDDPAFFEGTVPLSFGELPKLQDEVVVIGYPQGGGKVSITEGVVSRVELTDYSQTGRKLLAVQIDAAINPGNSGGPVIQDGKIVGVAMQVFHRGQNIGYIIPVPIIKHFFDDLDDGQYDGFPILGINFETTENPALREYYGLEKKDEGVLITRVLPYSPAFGHLQEGDIMLSIEGIQIGEDATFSFREDERLSMVHLITIKQVSDQLNVEVIRDKEKKKLYIDLDPFALLVPHPRRFKKPPYYIYGGLVFTVLSTDLLRTWGKRWWEKAPLDFAHYLIGQGRLNMEEREELVVLLNVLPDDINVGYHSKANDIIAKVNGETFKSFKEFVLLLEKTKKDADYTIVETEKRSKLLLDNDNIDVITQEIIERNNIPKRYSNDVGAWIKEAR